MLDAAEAWGIPPWIVEDAPLLWMDRYRAWAEAKTERFRQGDSPERGQTKQIGNKRVKRLI